MKLINHLRAFITTTLGTMVFVCAMAVTPTSDIINLVKAEVQGVQYYLPMDTGNGMQLTKVWYIPDKYTIAYRYETYYNVDKPSSNTIWETKQSVIHFMKAHPESKDMIMLKNGINYHYNYYNPDGTFLYAVKITANDLK